MVRRHVDVLALTLIALVMLAGEEFGSWNGRLSTVPVRVQSILAKRTRSGFMRLRCPLVRLRNL